MNLEEFDLMSDFKLDVNGNILFKKSIYSSHQEYCGIRIFKKHETVFKICRLMNGHKGEHIWSDYK